MRELFIRKPELYIDDTWMAMATSTLHIMELYTSAEIYDVDDGSENVVLKQSFSGPH